MDVLLTIVGVLVIAFLLYLGNRRRERRKLEAEAERRKLGEAAEGHRSMAGQHEARAEELREQAEREASKASRHQERAAEVDPEVQTEAEAK